MPVKPLSRCRQKSQQKQKTNSEATRQAKDSAVPGLSQPEYKTGHAQSVFPGKRTPDAQVSGHWPACHLYRRGKQRGPSRLRISLGAALRPGKVPPGEPPPPWVAPLCRHCPQGRLSGGSMPGCPPQTRLLVTAVLQLLPTLPWDPCLPDPRSPFSSLSLR